MTSKVYILPETAIEFISTGGDVVFTPTSVAAAAGRQSAQLDRGASARAGHFMWRAFTKFATTPVVGERVGVFIKTSDGTHLDNDDGTGDIDVSAQDKLRNLRQIGAIVVDEVSATPEFSASGFVFIPDRYLHVVFWNYTADALSATATDHGFILTPYAFQGQDT